jgi:hypothetical protein
MDSERNSSNVREDSDQKEQSWSQVIKTCLIMAVSYIPIDIYAATGHLPLWFRFLQGG